MFQKRKFNSLIVIALICLLCFFLPDIQAQTEKETTEMKIDYKGNVGGDCQPNKRLWVENGKDVIISVARFNNLTRDDPWELLGAYYKNDCYMTKWKNKKTAEEFEGLGTYPPNEQLYIDGHIGIGNGGHGTDLHIEKKQGKK